MTVSVTFFLTCLCARPDHNAFYTKYFAADEAQTFDAIFSNKEGEIDGMSVLSTTSRGVRAKERSAGLSCIMSATRSCMNSNPWYFW